MSFEAVTMSEQASSNLEGVFASEGYFEGVPGSFAVYQDQGMYMVEEHTGDPEMPAVIYPI